MKKQVLWLALVLLVARCGKEVPVTKEPSLDSPEGKKALMLKLVNEARAKGYVCGEDTCPPVGPLTWSELLEKSSLGHATDMTEKDYFSHDSLDGSKVSDRVTRTGYQWNTVGENIAKGQTSITEVVAGWLKSPGHCKNIMHAAFTQLGAARFKNTWVQNFGTPRYKGKTARD